MSARLFSVDSDSQRIEHFDDGIFLLRGFANSTELMAQVRIVCASAPLRHMTVPGGKQMSVAMSNCGPLGWTSDSSGYRYSATDPRTGNSWPAMPDAFMSLATRAATAAGFRNFKPDACLINEYQSNAKLSLHQDRDECDFTQPIVSVSMGADAVFQFGGLRRNDSKKSLLLQDGDVLVWGGPARLRYHGVGPPLADCRTGAALRVNLTLRNAA